MLETKAAFSTSGPSSSLQGMTSGFRHSKTVTRKLDTHTLLGLRFFTHRLLEAGSVARNDLQGSLDLLVLKTLSQRTKLHGYGIVLHIQKASDELLQVEEGSIYPALHRMEQSGWISSEWALTDTNRKAKNYRVKPAGQNKLQTGEKGL